MQSKSFIVIGSTITRNGVKQRDLAENVNAQLNNVLRNVDHSDVIDVKINVELQGASGDFAFVTVLLKGTAIETTKEQATVSKKRK